MFGELVRNKHTKGAFLWSAVKASFIVMVFLYAAFPAPALAQNVNFGFNTSFNQIDIGTQQDLYLIAARIVNIAFGFLGVVAVGLIMYGGFLWMSARGDEQQVLKAKRVLRNAIIGLIIILSSWSIATFAIDRLGGATGPGGGVPPPPPPPPPPLPGTQFRLDEFQTAHAGTTPDDDVYLCSSMQTRFNHWLDVPSTEALIASGDFEILRTQESCNTGCTAISPPEKTNLSSDVLANIAKFGLDPAGLDPSIDDVWKPYSKYEVRVPKSITDSSGNLIADCTPIGCVDRGGTYWAWEFTTTDKNDSIEPNIVSAVPRLDTEAGYPDRNINRSAVLSVNFNEDIDATSVIDSFGHFIPGSVTIQKLDGFGGLVTDTIPDDHFDVIVSRSGITFVLNSVHESSLNDGPYFDPYSWYRITVANITDLCGNPMRPRSPWEFQTNGNVPGIASVYPRDGYAFSCPNTETFIQFRTSMYDIVTDSCTVALTGGGLVKEGRGFSVVPRNLTVADPIPIGPPVDINDYCKRYDFIPDTNSLSVATTYSPEVDYINQSTGARNTHTWSFSVASAQSCADAPYISSISPSMGRWRHCITINGGKFQDPKLAGSGAGTVWPTSGNGFLLNDTNWSDRSISADFIGDLSGTEGPLVNNPQQFDITVTVNHPAPIGPLDSNAAPFAVDTSLPEFIGPCLYSISPNIGPWGTNVTLRGRNLTADGVGDYVSFSPNNDVPPPDTTFVDDTTVRSVVVDYVGGTATSDGDVTVTIDGQTSNGVRFDVTNGIGASCSSDNNMCVPDATLCDPGLFCSLSSCTCVSPNLRIIDVEPAAACVDSCTNATASFDTNNDIDGATLAGRVLLAECVDENCDWSAATPVGATITLVTLMNVSIVPNDLLKTDTWYRVRVDQGLGAASGELLQGLNYDSDGDGNLDSYSWKFKTGANECAPNELSLTPNSITVKVGETKNVYAELRSFPNACSAHGQLLNNGNGLFARWTMDNADIDASTNTLIDSVGSSNGTIINMSPITTVAGKLNEALEFDGSNDAVIGATTLELANGLTLAAWFRAPGSAGSAGTAPRLIEISSESDPAVLFQYSSALVIEPTGALRAWTKCATTGSGVRSGYIDPAPGTFVDGDWHLAVYTYDGAMGRMYVDGVLAASNGDNPCADINDASYFGIGFLGANHAFDGQLDDVRIYTRPLSSTDAQNLYTTSLAEYYKWRACRQTSTDPQVDCKPLCPIPYNSFIGPYFSVTGDGNTGEVTGLGGSASYSNQGWVCSFFGDTSPPAVPPLEAGKFGDALRFEGLDRIKSQQRILPFPPGVSTNELSMSMWIKPSSHGGGDSLALIGGAFWTRMFSGTPALYLYDKLPSPGYYEWGSSAPVGTWTHIAWTYNKTSEQLKLYKNGSLIATRIFSGGNIHNYDTTLVLGAYTSDATYKGLIDDFRLYNATLSDADIQNIYAGLPLGNPIVHYTFDSADTDWPNKTLSDASGNNNTADILFYGAGLLTAGIPASVTDACVSDGQCLKRYLEGGLVGRWEFNSDTIDVDNSIAFDSSPNNNDGDIINFNVGAIYDTPIIDSSILTSNNGNNHIEIPDDDSLTPGSLSIATWVYRNGPSPNNRAVFVGKYDAATNNRSYLLGAYSGDGLYPIRFRVSTDGSNWKEWRVLSSMDINQWYHIVVTYDGAGTARAYVNGADQGALPVTGSSGAPVTGPVFNDASKLFISGTQDLEGFGTQTFTYSTIEDIALYDRVLTLGEIRTLYNGQCQRSSCVEGQCMPTITSFTPNNGAVGTWTNIAGCYFGNRRGEAEFNQGGTYTPFNIPNPALCGSGTWTDTLITAEVPNVPLGNGTIKVTTREGKAFETANNFLVNTTVRPGLCRLYPSSGTAGLTNVELTGQNFEATQGATDSATFAAIPVVTYNEWSDSRINVVVPPMVPINTDVSVKVIKGANESGVLPFHVNDVPPLLPAPIHVESYTPGEGHIACLNMVVEVVLDQEINQSGNIADGSVKTGAVTTGETNNFEVRDSSGTSIAGEVGMTVFSNRTRLQFIPDAPYTPSSVYTIYLRGGATGIGTDEGGIIEALPADACDPLLGADCIIDFNTVNDADQGTQCVASHITVTPADQRYFCAGIDDCENDDSADSGHQRNYTAAVIAQNGQIIAPPPGAQFEWKSSDTTILSPLRLDVFPMQQFTIEPKDGSTVISAKITGTSFIGATQAWVLVCENPWPPRAPFGIPFRDADSGVTDTTAGNKTNFSTMYCMDGAVGRACRLPQLLSNPSAESGMTGWVSTDFNADGSPGSGGVIADEQSFNGDNVFDANNDGGVKQSVTVETGKTYTLSAAARVYYGYIGQPTDDSIGYIVVQTIGGTRDIVDEKCNTASVDDDPSTEGQWMFCSATFVAPANTIEIGVRGEQITHHVAFDYVSLVEGSRAQTLPGLLFGPGGVTTCASNNQCNTGAGEECVLFIEDDLPGLTKVRESTSVPGLPNLLKEIFFTLPNRQTGGDDAIGIRVFSNLEHDSLQDWYDKQSFPKGNPEPMTVNGYEAMRDGRTVYVSAPNFASGKAYTNIYLFSYSTDASAATVRIYNQLVNNWNFTVTVLLAEDRLKMQRDTKRLTDIGAAAALVEAYRDDHQGVPPLLNAGTFEKNVSTSVWPSWKGNFGEQFSSVLPLDPLNEVDAAGCASVGATKDTCWKPDTQTFSCRNTNYVYHYRAQAGSLTDKRYTLRTNLEYNSSLWQHPSMGRWARDGNACGAVRYQNY